VKSWTRRKFFIPLKRTQLETAIRTDMKVLLCDLAAYAKDNREINCLSTECNSSDTLMITAEALEFIHIDSCADNEGFKGSNSYEYGLNLVLEMALEFGRPPSWNFNQMHSCMIALIARGRVQQAYDLARLAGALEFMATSTEPYVKAKKMGEFIKRHKVLRQLESDLKNDQVPTHKALCFKTFGTKKAKDGVFGEALMGKPQFSRLIRGMEITKVLPHEPRYETPKVEGTIYKFDLNRKLSAPRMVSSRDAKRVVRPQLAPIETPLRPTRRLHLFDSNLKRIQESLGPVYHLLLLQFQMPEPTNHRQLGRFVKRLSMLGLELGTARS
jgi:hypothetical protein